MSRIFTLALFTFLAHLSMGQINIQWESRFDGTSSFIDKPVDLEIDASGNSYVTGTSFDGGNYDWVTIKYDASGVAVWISTYGGVGLDEATSLVIDTNGDIIVTGSRFISGSDYDIAVVKYDGTTGAVLWSDIFAGSGNYDAGQDITVDTNDDIIIVGSYGQSTTNVDYIVVKYPSAGSAPSWSYTALNATGNDEGKLVLTDAANNIFLGGHSDQGGTYVDFMLLKFGTGGGAPTNSGYRDSGFGNLDTPNSMAFDGAGNVILGGQGFTTIQDEDDFMLVKFNNNCVFQWLQTDGGDAEGSDRINAVVIDQGTNDIFVTGKSKSIATSEDYYTIAYNSAGVEQWNKRYTTAGFGFDESTDLKLSGTGFLYVTGISDGGATNNDYTTIKYDQTNGDYQWETRFDGPSSLSDQALKMRLDASENIFITGTSHGGVTNLDYSTIKYCQLTTVASNDTSICDGQSVNLTASGGTNITWAVLSGDFGSLSCTLCGTTTVSPSVNSVYTVSSASASGCIDFDTVEVTVNSIPLPTIYFDTPTTFCDGDSVTLYTDSYVSYSWNPAGVDSFLTVYTSATYDVTITDENGCQAMASEVVTLNALPNVSAGTDDVVCPGDVAFLVATGALTYLWDFDPTLSSTVIANPEVTPTAITDYYVTGTDVNGCESRDTVEVSLHSPIQVIASSGQNICLNDSIQLNASGVVSYLWDTDGSFLDPTNISNPYVQPLVQNEFFVTGTDVNNCNTRDSVTISLIALPGINAGPDKTICEGQNVQIFVTGGLSYVWNTDPTLSAENISNPFADPLIQTTYIVSGTDVNTCTNTDTVIVFVNTLPNVSAGADFSVCPDGSAQLNASGAVSYDWDSDPSFTTFTNISNPQALPTSATLYSVTGTDANNCQNTDQILVGIFPTASIDAGVDVMLCEGDSVQLEATGGVSFVWGFDATLSNFIIGDPWANPTIDNEYIVTGTDANNCTGEDTMWVFVNPVPVAPVIVEDSIWLISSYTSGNQWYLNGSLIAGEVNDTLIWTQLSNGSYTLLYTDVNGCSIFSLVTNIIVIDDVSVEEDELFGVSIYPNPTSSILNVSINESIDYLYIYNLSGELILKMDNLNPGINEVNMDELARGMYVIQLVKDEKVLTKRIIKQ